MNYQDALDLIFKSFIAAKPLIQGKFDREVRKPELLLGVAGRLDILPDAQKVIKVTGSKGKGTVARLCSRGLEQFGKTGLLISPEEIEHTDRMRINAHAITPEKFIRCFEKIWTEVEEPSLPDYLSPYGLFLLTALMWFKEENVDFYVIETGRGVRFDEGGQLPAKVGVVTSIFLEHAGYLGPSLEEIRKDKLSISQTVETVLHGCETLSENTDMPAWYINSQHTAKAALETFLGRDVDLPDAPCASFGQREGRWFYEGLIAPDSADKAFIKQLIKKHKDKLVFYISLPDDKDIEGVHNLIADLGGGIKHIIMTGERGVLSYEKARQYDVAYEGPYDDGAALKEGLNITEKDTVYFIGTQTFLRLVKQVYFL